MNKIVFLVLTIIAFQNAFAECVIANDKNSYGTACSSLSRKDAEEKAIVKCGKSGGHDCRVMAHFENACWAIAKDRALEISAYAYGKATLEQAKSESISACSSHGGKNCSNTENSGCETVSQVKNPQQSTTKSQFDVAARTAEINCEAVDGWWSRVRCRSEQNNKKKEEDRLKKEEDRLEKLRFNCDTFGFKRDTVEHAQCMMQLQAQAQTQALANSRAAAKSDQDLQDLLKPRHQSDDLKPDVINSRPSTPLFDFNPKMHSSCTSTVSGNKVYTTCN
jgi:hypothetical protein